VRKVAVKLGYELTARGAIKVNYLAEMVAPGVVRTIEVLPDIEGIPIEIRERKIKLG
jgi:hypothetical protein